MGLYKQIIIDREVDTPEEAERLGAQMLEWLARQDIAEGQDLADDLKLSTQRDCFFIGQGSFGPTRCAHCGGEIAIDRIYDAGGAWLEGGSGEFHCEACGTLLLVTQCEHPDIAFATLGFEFRDWPSLTPDFLDAFARQLSHRVSFIQGKN